MTNCIYNDQPTQAKQAKIVYRNGSIELVNNVKKAYINENTYVIQSTSGSVILTLSEVIKIDMRMMKK